jgi:hypothetical protein
MRGRVSNKHWSVAGGMRMVARFHRKRRLTAACDSGEIRWAVGRRARRIVAARPYGRRPSGSHYPPAPSLAGAVSRRRARFIRRIDAACLEGHRAIKAAEPEAHRLYAGRPNAGLLVYATYVRAHAAQYAGIRRAGRAPEARSLYERWLANMRRRIQLEYLRGARLERGDLAAARSLQARIDRMEARGNITGQRFGLRICTSNGPGRALVPHY